MSLLRLVAASVSGTVGFGIFVAFALMGMAQGAAVNLGPLGRLVLLLGVLLFISPFVIYRDAFTFGSVNSKTPENWSAVLHLLAYCCYVFALYAVVWAVRTRFGELVLGQVFLLILGGAWGWMMGPAWLRFEAPRRGLYEPPQQQPRFDVKVFLGESTAQSVGGSMEMLRKDRSRLILATGCFSASIAILAFLVLAAPVVLPVMPVPWGLAASLSALIFVGILWVLASSLWPDGYGRHKGRKFGAGALALVIVSQICFSLFYKPVEIVIRKHLGDAAPTAIIMVLIGCVWGWTVGRAWLRAKLKKNAPVHRQSTNLEF